MLIRVIVQAAHTALRCGTMWPLRMVYVVMPWRAVLHVHSRLCLQIDGIWHTGVVLDGHEYFFGQGIQRCRAGATPFGTPMQVVDLGCAFCALAMLRAVSDLPEAAPTRHARMQGCALRLVSLSAAH